ncbi:sensor domain-containing diguanylate cyclase [Oceanospirillum maris]|uniref:sensor domain-containing diguanylate cyclase n=1 Tax=Oceanospirillum maris TaxID=64977 RepID=UPI00040885B4|nr:GGDEF domain-containing protein [Oceanospirillum maris]
MQLFEQALGVLQSGVMILDGNYRIHFINQWLNKAFDSTPDLQGEQLFNSYPELEGKRIHQAIEQAIKVGLPSLLSPGLNRSPLPLYRGEGANRERFPQSIRVQPMQVDSQRFCVVEVQDVSSMIRREALLNQQAEKLNQMALTDELTGINNRRHFNMLLEKELRRSNLQGTPLSLVLFDIDFFKQYNDHFGHPAGDKCLIAIADYLKHQLSSYGYQVARYGGEEFCIILPEQDVEVARHLAERCREEVEQLQIQHPSSQVAQVVTASFGIASKSGKQSETQTSLILRADNALYRAKLAGRNRVIASERLDEA